MNKRNWPTANGSLICSSTALFGLRPFSSVTEKKCRKHSYTYCGTSQIVYPLVKSKRKSEPPWHRVYLMHQWSFLFSGSFHPGPFSPSAAPSPWPLPFPLPWMPPSAPPALARQLASSPLPKAMSKTIKEQKMEWNRLFATDKPTKFLIVGKLTTVEFNEFISGDNFEFQHFSIDQCVHFQWRREIMRSSGSLRNAFVEKHPLRAKIVICRVMDILLTDRTMNHEP